MRRSGGQAAFGDAAEAKRGGKTTETKDAKDKPTKK
jgi:hypothetical protein